MLKNLLLASLFSSFTFLSAQEEPKDLLSIPSPIEINGTEYYLSWSKQQSKTLSVQQFLPNDERIEDFTQLLTFSYFNKDIELEYAVRSKMEGVQQMSANDKFAKVNLTESPDGLEFIIDYTLSSQPGEKTPYLEYNIQRFKKYDKDPKPLLILAYTKRIYGDQKIALRTFNKQRDHLLTALIEYKIPTIALASQEPKEESKKN